MFWFLSSAFATERSDMVEIVRTDLHDCHYDTFRQAASALVDTHFTDITSE